jgi:hypothetical protein
MGAPIVVPALADDQAYALKIGKMVKKVLRFTFSGNNGGGGECQTCC